MKKILTLLFLVLLCLPIVSPYFQKGFFPTHDGEWAVVRLSEMFREAKDFQFPPRYSTYLNFGHGYPLFNFAYPLPYYLGLLIYALKFGFVGSIKVLFILSVIFSAIFMFLASSSFWKSKWAGLISSVFYIYFPYRIVDLYVRGSIGESLAFTLFPLVFFCVVRIVNGSSSRLLIVLGSLSYAALILTHNIMAVFFTIVLILFILGLFLIGERKRIAPLLFFIVFGILISSFFWLPAVFEKKYILLSTIPIADRNLYFVNLEQLIIPKWGYGVPTERNGFSYQLGMPHLIILFLTVIFLIFSYLKKKEVSKDTSLRYALVLVLITFFLMFFLFQNSSFLWKLPFLSEINYPWTMLAPIGFLVSLLAGFISSRTTVIKYVGLFLAGVSIFLILPYAKPQYNVDRGDGFYMTNDATTTSSLEYTPLWVKTRPTQKPINRIEIIGGTGAVKDIVYKSNKISFNIFLSTDTRIRINTIYYPGWRAYVDGNQSLINYSNDKGVMDLLIGRGNHNIKLTFSETPLRLFADILSILSFITLLLFIKAYNPLRMRFESQPRSICRT